MDVKRTIFFPDGRFIWIFQAPETLLVEDADGGLREIRSTAIEREMWGKKGTTDKRGRGEATSQRKESRFVRLKDAPAYLGMDPNRFNAEVRPYLTEMSIGKQGIAFDRVDLDAWAVAYKDRNGRPGKAMKGGKPWDASEHRGSSKEAKPGTSRRQSPDDALDKALERILSKKQSDT
ncbi:MAG: hypothetical protein ACLP5H_04200 [Desulfomonilaceae bacterium]